MTGEGIGLTVLLRDAQAYAREADAEPGLVCNYCPTLWNRVGGLRRFGDQQCPNCGDLYPGTNREP